MPNWGDILGEIQTLQARGEGVLRGSVDIVRREYLKSLHEKTGRNVIAYYSGWLSRSGGRLAEISDEDKNGFMATVHGLDRNIGLDLILHTPGGAIGATQSLVYYLRKMFGEDIRAIIPQIAMSAGTMIACCCKQILMAKHSNLGPIDPHVNGLPAQGVIEEFERACREVAANPATMSIWQAVVAQYEPAFLGRCQQAIEWSNGFVQEQLESVMFNGQDDASDRAKKIVSQLADHSSNRTHDKHIHFEECREMGLEVSLVEDDPELQELVVSVHHCYMHTIMGTDSIKLIENHNGTAFVRHVKS